MFGLAQDIRIALRAAQAAGRSAALATLHTIVGGGPRPPGTQMLLSPLDAAGFLSGGCVEGDVAIHAARTIEDGEPRHLVYGDGSPWADIRLLCGARIEVLVERVAPSSPAVLALLDETRLRRPCVWVTDGRSQSIEPVERAADPVCSVLSDPFRMRLRLEPVPRLIVVGGDPAALAIASLAAQAGFETTLVRPRGPASPPPLPGVAYRRDTPALALEALGPDRWTAIAVATHDWDLDQEALVAALKSKAGYIGVLGAERRVAERLRRLAQAGVDETALGRIRAPIGLDLGGKAPWEVAVSVVGEVIAERSGSMAAGVRVRV